MNRCVLGNLVAVVFICLAFLGCVSKSSDSQKQITLRALEETSLTDTMSVSDCLPLMPQKQEALYHVKDNSTMMETKSIYIDTILAPDYRIIPLETTEKCLVSEVENLLVDDSLIFILDPWTDRVLIFDLDGKFKNKIDRKGHAANEFASMTRVTLDRQRKRVCVMDRDSQKLLFYDYQGNFLSKESRFFWYENIAFFADKRVLLTLPYQHTDYKALNSFKLTVTDENGKPVCGALADPGFPKHQFAYSLSNPLHPARDGVFYLDVLSPDTIWKVQEAECVPFVAADFGEPFTTLQTYREMTTERHSQRQNEVKFIRDDFAFSKDFGYLYYGYGNCAVIDLSTGKYLTGRLDRRGNRPEANFLEYAFETHPSEKFFLFDWEQNQFAKVWDADETLRLLGLMRKNKGGEEVYQSWPKSDRDILDKLSPEDNPLIVVGTFKKF